MRQDSAVYRGSAVRMELSWNNFATIAYTQAFDPGGELTFSNRWTFDYRANAPGQLLSVRAES